MVSGLIVAAGKGERLPGSLAKQYLPLSGRPVLCRTLAVFVACPLVDDLVLVVPQKDFGYCREVVLPQITTAKRIRLAAGGDRRQDSVAAGLGEIADDPNRIVVIHDGVRPFVSSAMISACVEGLRQADGCITAVPVNDTVKAVDRHGRITGTLDRDTVWLAQTPQAFRYGVLLAAHRRAAQEQWQVTDDAALVEQAGGTVRVVTGSTRNIKITTPEDLRLAEAIVALVPGE